MRIRTVSLRETIRTISNHSNNQSVATVRQASSSSSSSSSSSAQQQQSSYHPTRILSESLHPTVRDAFELAKSLIHQDSQKHLLEIKRLREQVEDPPADQIERLEILSQINDVRVRENYNAGQIDLSKPIYRFLAEQDWRKSGRLGKLMETVHRLRVIPDLLPSIDPTSDLKIGFGTSSAGMGSFVPSSATLSPPIIHAQVFHPGEELYTLLMIDPDVPDQSRKSFKTYLHWMVPNIPISAISKNPVDTNDQSGMSLPYIPPHPPRGSPIHRYTILLFKQRPSQGSSTSFIKFDPSKVQRDQFSVREWVSSTGSIPSGVISWLSKWREADAETISMVYKDQLKIDEPIYGEERNERMGPRKRIENEKLPLTHRHPRVIPWRSVVKNQKDE
ncbi:phosphatidylethanolamine-binding protein [Phakopsora pachyrhizi]|nr:phosphatidylethanolamine-binding protein [Phakopsora pachyrhizi]KAI8451233.1 phosphatidylethanolamine-binding protein [Phakopsora pachyrhizi]